MPNDEFELLLERCRERLSDIRLQIPTLESAAKPAPVYTLKTPADVAPPPQPPPKAKTPAPLPVRREDPPPPPAPLAVPLEELPAPPPPVKEEPPARPSLPERDAARQRLEREEDDVFPPLVRARTPPPSTPLWSAPPAPARAEAPPPRSLPSGRRPTAAAATVAVVVTAGAFGVWLARRPAADLIIPVGDAEAMAVRPEKGDVLVAEGKELIDLSRDGRMLDRKPLEVPVDSLCWDQGSLWSADGRTPALVEHGDGGRETVFRLNHVPNALYVKDRYLWTSEKDGSMLHQFLISRSILGAILQPLDSFELTGLSPEGFTIDDSGILWLADTTTRRLYRLRLDNGTYKRVSSAPLSPFLGPKGKMRDLTVEGGAVWILAQGGDGRVALRRIVLGHLDWTPE